MEADYGKRLKDVAAALPAEARVIGLLARGDRAEAAALAADLAAAVAERRAGHTVLASLEAAPAALDHEVGAEGARGLSDVLRGRAALADVAASGRGRGFIYVPAGADPIPPDRLLASRAWAALASSAVARGATLLLFLPPGTAASGIGGRVDGVVWLGEPRARGAPGAPKTSGGRARDPTPVLGRLAPPAADREAGPAAVARPTAPSAPVIRRDPRRGRRRSGHRVADSPDEERGPRLPRSRRRGRRRLRRRRKRRGGVLLVLLLAGAALAAGVLAVLGPDRVPFLPGGDPAPPAAPPEREDTTPDTVPTDTATVPDDTVSGRDGARRYFSIGARTRFPHSVHEPS